MGYVIQRMDNEILVQKAEFVDGERKNFIQISDNADEMKSQKEQY
jgi:hypothetical protein